MSSTDSKRRWIELGENRFFARSKWEANYARYLEWLRLDPDQGNEVIQWSHEKSTFWFEAIKRGVRSYLPDFKVTKLVHNKQSGTSKLVSEYHEIKGHMDNKSLTKLKRMAKYYPDVQIVLIDAYKYAEIERTIGRRIPGWES